MTSNAQPIDCIENYELMHGCEHIDRGIIHKELCVCLKLSAHVPTAQFEQSREQNGALREPLPNHNSM